jgi:WD40 repeat protein
VSGTILSNQIRILFFLADKGLQSYDEKDGDLFFGREEQIEKLYQKVIDNKQRLTLVLGASGTGKSSLVKAGLIPKLKQDDNTWSILPPFRPGESPFKSLNNVLESVKQPLIATSPEATSSDLLTAAEKSLANWFNNNPEAKLMMVIDQFEELITLCKSEEREQFQKLIKNSLATYSDNIHVVITLRLDFEALFQTSVLKDFWNGDARFVVPPMTQDELREVIEKPASKKVLYFDPPSLVDELINEVVQMPGALPLLSFTLSELYLKCFGDRTRDNRALTKKDYEELGRVVGSITKRANQEYEKLVGEDPAYKDTVRRVMLRMISLQGGELARRQVPKSELEYPDQEENQRVQTVIKRFSQARLIVEGSNSQGKEYVEPAHDYLVRGWPQIKNWLEEKQETVEKGSRWNQIKEWLNTSLGKVTLLLTSKEDSSKSKSTFSKAEQPLKVNLPLQRELTIAANQWKSVKQNSEVPKTEKQPQKAVGWLWDDDPRLPLAEQVYRSTDNWLNQVEAEFVIRSVGRQKFKTRRNWGIAGFVLLGSMIFSAEIWRQLKRTELREKAANVENLLNTRPVDGLILAIDAMGQNLSLMKWLPLTIDAPVRSSLLSAVQSAREQNRFQKHEGFVNSVAFSPDGKIVSGAADGKLILWDKKGNLVRFEDQHDSEEHRDVLDGVVTVAVSPNGEIIVTGGGDYNLMFWKRDGKQIKLIKNLPQEYIVKSVAFSSDGHKIAGAVGDKVFLWNREGQLLLEKPFKGHEDYAIVNSIAFSPDGQIIVSGGDDGKICLWSLEEKPNKCIEGDTDSVNTVAFSPDGQTIVSGSSDGKLSFWSPQLDPKGESRGGHIFGIGFRKFSRAVTSIDFHPESPIVVSGGDDGTIRLWNLEGNLMGQQLDIFRGHEDFVSSVAFSPDGETIASGSSDFTVRLWEVRGGSVGKPFTQHTAILNLAL